MKLIIIEGGDRLGKSTIITGLCKYFNYDNVTVRHFGKPPKGLSPKEVLDFQFGIVNVFIAWKVTN
jgi:thymidylate kinase